MSSTVKSLPGLVLANINKIRLLNGTEPLAALPIGRTSQPADCPIQRALRDIDPLLRVGSDCIEASPHLGRVAARLWKKKMMPTRGGMVLLETPGYWRSFIELFDEGFWPELVAEELDQVPDTVPAEWAEEHAPTAV